MIFYIKNQKKIDSFPNKQQQQKSNHMPLDHFYTLWTNQVCKNQEEKYDGVRAGNLWGRKS